MRKLVSSDMHYSNLISRFFVIILAAVLWFPICNAGEPKKPSKEQTIHWLNVNLGKLEYGEYEKVDGGSYRGDSFHSTRVTEKGVIRLVSTVTCYDKHTLATKDTFLEITDTNELSSKVDILPVESNCWRGAKTNKEISKLILSCRSRTGCVSTERRSIISHGEECIPSRESCMWRTGNDDLIIYVESRMKERAQKALSHLITLFAGEDIF